LASGFTMDTSKFKSAKHLNDKFDKAMQGVCRYWDGKVEAYMKTTAPWTDRTTNARNGLAAKAVKVEKFRHWILLTHSVHYGIYLETKNDGKYAVIMPTIRVYGPKVMSMFNKIMDRLDQRVGGA
jgi:hypothetical protein